MENVNSKRAATYSRVSTDEQAQNGMSIDVQVKTNREKAEEDGYEVVAELKDEGKSGGTMNRAGIREIVRLVTEKKIEAVYCIHSDRIARNTLDYLTLRELLREKGVILKCLYQPMTDESATSRTMDTVVASFNEMQRLVTSEKVRATLYEKAKAGYFPTTPPPGYKNIDNPDVGSAKIAKKIVVKDEETAPLVQEMFRLFATGEYNGYDLADIMFERGLRTRVSKSKKTGGGKLSKSQLYQVLRNRFYLNEVHWGPVHCLGGKHGALIEPYVFNQVQAILDSHNKHACRRRKYSWLLGGFLYCYMHERRYTAEWHLIKTKRIAYYHCPRREGCGKYAEMVAMEDKVAEKFKELELAPEFVELVISKAKAIFFERRQGYDKKRKGLVNQRTAQESRMRSLEDSLIDRGISSDRFAIRRDEITAELTRIDEQLAQLEKGHSMQVDVAQEVLRFTSNIYEAYISASPNIKRHYLSFFWKKFEVADGVIIKSYPSLLFDQLLKLQQAVSQKPKKPLAETANGLNGVILPTSLLRG